VGRYFSHWEKNKRYVWCKKMITYKIARWLFDRFVSSKYKAILWAGVKYLLSYVKGKR